MLNREKFLTILEAKEYNTDEMVFIHHPVTQDVVKCKVIETKIDKLLLGFDETSDYFGQPEFWFKKLYVIGKA